MKPANFDYACPRTVDEACRLLAGANGDGKIIAGGQTLVPLLAMRLARPALLIDINRIEALRGIEAHDRVVTVKACTRQADALKSDAIRAQLPLLAKALQFVGHPQTRNRGTVGGSLANADPAAEIGVAALALDCEIVARRPGSERTIPIGAFFQGTMSTALAAEECLTAIRFRASRDAGRIGTSFQEVSIRRSDFALVAAAVQLGLDAGGACRRIAISLGGIGEMPVRVAEEAATSLVGTRLAAADLAKAVAAIRDSLEPRADIHASADYRRRVAGALVERAIAEARDEALAGKG